MMREETKWAGIQSSLLVPEPGEDFETEGQSGSSELLCHNEDGAMLS